MTPGRAVVFGLGRFGGGAGAARCLAREGWSVLATDLRDADVLAPTIEELGGLDVEYALGGHRPEDFEKADLVVANPAVRPDHALLARARGRGARITTEVEMFLERARNPLVAVTGTQGKSSTVRMTADFLTAADVPARAGGNLGGSLCDALAELSSREVCVLELSSYQLEHLAAPAPRMSAVAVVNVLSDHLERHGDRAAYAAAKRRILDLVADGGMALCPGDDPELSAWRPPRGERVDVWPRGRHGAREPGLFLEEGVFRFGEETLGQAEDLRLPGAFQRENALFALGLAYAVGAAPERLAAAVGTARGLEHRLEDMGLRGGRRVIDNGVSTTPDSTLSALLAVEEGATLIVGGEAKRGLGLEELVAAARARQACVVSFGASGPALAAAFSAGGVEARAARTLEEAVALAFRGPRGSTVLFSPAAASFDAYPNFRARALAFRAALPEPDGR